VVCLTDAYSLDRDDTEHLKSKVAEYCGKLCSGLVDPAGFALYRWFAGLLGTRCACIDDVVHAYVVVLCGDTYVFVDSDCDTDFDVAVRSAIDKCGCAYECFADEMRSAGFIPVRVLDVVRVDAGR